jgi:hypothetical protein
MSIKELSQRTRRETLLGGIGLGGAWIASRGPGRLLGADDAGAASCLLTPEVTEGPYWISNRLTRRDIRAGQKGTGLLLYLTVENAKTCKVISGADDTLSEKVYSASSLYTVWSSRQVHNTGDNIYTSAGSAKAQLKLSKRSGSKGYLGRITMGVTV